MYSNFNFNLKDHNTQNNKSILKYSIKWNKNRDAIKIYLQLLFRQSFEKYAWLYNFAAADYSVHDFKGVIWLAI